MNVSLVFIFSGNEVGDTAPQGQFMTVEVPMRKKRHIRFF